MCSGLIEASTQIEGRNSSMIRSMYSGISGLKNFQTKLDVIGNNISNVNTYGFKKGRTVFKDLISQTTSGASGASENRGGVNAKQVGLGSQLASIDTIHTGGSLQSTGNTLDLAISGDGFFQVADGNATEPTSYSNTQYTRAGNFYMDSNGYLVNSDGKYLVGFSASIKGTLTLPPKTDDGEEVTIENQIFHPTPDQIKLAFDYNAEGGPIVSGDNDSIKIEGLPTDAEFDKEATVTYKPLIIPTTAQSMSVAQDGTVTYVDQFGTLRWAGQITMAKFANPGGLEKAGGNYFRESPNSGNPVYNAANSGGNGSVQSGFLEMSNVDLSEEFTDMIVAQRGFQANTRIITTSDQILEELVNLKR